jgi:hypothetical protein
MEVIIVSRNHGDQEDIHIILSINTTDSAYLDEIKRKEREAKKYRKMMDKKRTGHYK